MAHYDQEKKIEIILQHSKNIGACKTILQRTVQNRKRRDGQTTSVNRKGRIRPQPKSYIIIAISGVKWCGGGQLCSASAVNLSY